MKGSAALGRFALLAFRQGAGAIAAVSFDVVFEMRKRAYVLLAERPQHQRRCELVETAQVHDEIKLAQNKRAAVVRREAVANADIDVGMKRWAPDQDRVAKADVARRIEFRHLAGLFDRSGVQVGGAEPDRIWRHV